MMDNEMQKTEEFGIVLVVPETRSTAERLKYYNPSLSSVREAVFCTLQIECHGRTEALQCLDTVSGTGLVGLQWKKYLRDTVHVVASHPDTSHFYTNCETNNIHAAEWPIDENHRPGELPKCKQSEAEIYVCPQNGNIALHKEAFSFVYLQPNGTTSSYLDSLFTNLRHNGVACLVSPDISSQCVRSSHLIQRHYHAHVIKTDYLREMAARVVIGAAARTAARYNKGIEVLCTISLADHLLITVRVTRKQGEQTLKLSRHVVHCLMCEERVVYPDTHTVLESPYKLLPCECKSTNPGRTAVLLGPMWCGNIFSVPYLEKLKSQVKATFPKSKLNNLIETVLTEAKCQGMHVTHNNNEKVPPILETKEEDSDEPVSKKQKLENGCHHADTETLAEQQDKTFDDESDNSEKSHGFSPRSSVSEKESQGFSPRSSVSETRRPTSECQSSSRENVDTPLFYHGLHQKKFRTSVLPKSDKLVTMLRSGGFRASRTHFDPTAIRTNATIKQMQQVMNREPVNR